MTPDDEQAGRGELFAAFVFSVASLAFVVWMAVVSSGSHTLFAATSSDAPEAAADIASQVPPSP